MSETEATYAVQVDKRLHLRVAEALGWVGIEPGGLLLPGSCVGYPPGAAVIGHKEQVPRYDTDWRATGPLIEKYDIHLGPRGKDVRKPERWEASWYSPEFDDDLQGFHSMKGATPLAAVCNLLIGLREAGKI